MNNCLWCGNQSIPLVHRVEQQKDYVRDMVYYVEWEEYQCSNCRHTRIHSVKVWTEPLCTLTDDVYMKKERYDAITKAARERTLEEKWATVIKGRTWI